MHTFRNFLLKKSFLIRIILSYVVVGLLIIGVLTVTITSKFSDNLKTELTHSTDKELEQSYNTANIILSSTYQQFAHAYSSDDIQAGLYANKIDTILMGRIGNELSSLVITNPLVHSVYLANMTNHTVFSSLTTARSFDEFYDKQILKMLEDTDPLRASIFVPRETSFTYDTKPFSGNLISVAYLSTRVGKITNGALILNLNQQVLQKMMMNGEGSRSFQSMILNRQGTIISHSDQSMINKKLDNNEAIKNILNSDKEKGIIETNIDGINHRIFYIKSDSLEWVFIGDINYNILFSQVSAIERFILTVTSILLAVVLLCIAFFTRMIYAPIQQLIKHTSKAMEHRLEGHVINEFEMLSDTFRYLENKVLDLQTSVAGYQYGERRDLLQQLVRGGWGLEKDMYRKLAHIGIHLDDIGYQVCILRIDAYDECIEKYSTNDIFLLKYAITNIVNEVGATYYKTYCIDDGEDRIIILLSKTQDTYEHVQQFLQEIQANVKKYLRLSISAAIGEYVSRLQEVPDSWQAAFRASRYRLAYGHACIIPVDIEVGRDMISSTLSATSEKQITDSMKIGEIERTHELLSTYIQLIRIATFDEMMLLLNQLLLSVTRTAKSMSSGNQAALQMDMGSLSQQLNSKETLEQVEEWFIALCENAIQSRDKQSSQKNIVIVEKLKHYIQENYEDANLTVEMMVEVAGLSVNYMRKVFKDIMGISINQFLSDVRFEKAKDLLITTDLPANRIGEMVGFSNTKYFYISFKKYSGKSPDHFRKSSTTIME
ncbi:helix-turn-helix domain-containing protein [Paenibacillus sp. FSL R10-2734]|uniref:helix-turn-helix domain-containing protein n=1 Tax=Paenibacillus sp. FSL R10-2734 TaxID=2954691 RepID=UPI0030DC9745